MASIRGATLEAHLRGAKERMNSVYGEVEFYAISGRLHTLELSLDSIEQHETKTSHELYRHFPSAAIATLETHFKSTIALIVNSDNKCVEKGLSLLKDNTLRAIDIIPLLHKSTATIGEIVAHFLPFNSIASIENPFSQLLDGSLKQMLGNVRDPYDVRHGLDNSRKVIDNVDMLWCRIGKAFEQRHILAHEAASDYVVTYSEALNAIDSVRELIKGLDALMWATIWHSVPLTQRELNEDAYISMQAARRKLAERLRDHRHDDPEFRTLHFAWKRYFRAVLEFKSREIMGSIRPLIYAKTAERMLKARIDDLIPDLSENP